MDLIELESLKKRISNVDLFISFCSFDARTFQIAKSLPYEKVKIALVFINKKAPEEAKQNLEVFKTAFNEKCIIESVELFDPIALADNMFSSIRKVLGENSHHNILVDVTSFNHESLCIFVALSSIFLNNNHIDFVYCNALSYASEAEVESQKWLSRGISDVRTVLGFSGDFDSNRETTLIMMVGYESERAWRIIDTLSPDQLIITYNDSTGSTTEANCDADERYANLLEDLAVYYEKPDKYIIPSNDPIETMNELEKIIKCIRKDNNIILVPMNNKLSTIGAAMLGLKYPEIQLCYAPATIYNTKYYSTPGNRCYLFNFIKGV